MADIVAFGAAIDYMQETGIENISRHEQELLHYTTKALSTIDGFKEHGEAPAKAGVISFLIGDIHPYDMGTIIDKMGIAVRTGHHCAQPVMEHYGISGTVRASLGMYNTREDADHLAEAVKKAKKMLS
ncbi:MAG: aminotransferase class V-fold PLP-dependent enzyme [Bacteroidales bacterium]|nr:aminotransferase class V-fold PLP-dependent enzyme [Bacteroidales bacterium]